MAISKTIRLRIAGADDYRLTKVAPGIYEVSVCHPVWQRANAPAAVHEMPLQGWPPSLRLRGETNLAVAESFAKLLGGRQRRLPVRLVPSYEIDDDAAKTTEERWNTGR